MEGFMLSTNSWSLLLLFQKFFIYESNYTSKLVPYKGFGELVIILKFIAIFAITYCYNTFDNCFLFILATCDLNYMDSFLKYVVTLIELTPNIIFTELMVKASKPLLWSFFTKFSSAYLISTDKATKNLQNSLFLAFLINFIVDVCLMYVYCENFIINIKFTEKPFTNTKLVNVSRMKMMDRIKNIIMLLNLLFIISFLVDKNTHMFKLYFLDVNTIKKIILFAYGTILCQDYMLSNYFNMEYYNLLVKTNYKNFVESPRIIIQPEKKSTILKTYDQQKSLNNEEKEILQKLYLGQIKTYNIEMFAPSFKSAVKIRRDFIMKKYGRSSIKDLPYKNYPYQLVNGQCCENVIGYCTIPLGCIGPLLINNKEFWIPLATTEGCLLASINRGFSALKLSKGVTGVIINDGMTRCPVIKTENVSTSLKIKKWIDDKHNFQKIKQVFDSTSRFAKLNEIFCLMAGNLLFVRFKASTGDAMGMNMVSKAVEQSLEFIKESCHNFFILSLSGNVCSDKKSAAINWINGRGKSVCCEAILPVDIIKKVLKVDNMDKFIEIHTAKNYVGSALAGSIGGFNAHAANSVAAIFAACGQDLGQIVECSSCLTIIAKHDDDHLYISCTMPTMEVGTIGGGTILTTQKACLNIMNVYDSKIGTPSETLALLVCGTVLAGEISLLAALYEGTLVKSHLKYNRSMQSFSNNSIKESIVSDSTFINDMVMYDKKSELSSNKVNSCPMI